MPATLSGAAIIARDLATPDVRVQNQAVAAIRASFASSASRAAYDLRNTWGSALLKAKRYAELDELCSQAIGIDAAKLDAVEALQLMRVKALIALGKQAEALAQAKALFNVSRMASTADAIRLIVECLSPPLVKDPTLLNRYKAEQIAGAEVTKGAATRPATSQVLAGVKISAAPYEAAIRELNAEDYPTLVARGNLLLLSDKPAEARDAFERAYVIAPDKSLAAATENLARAMKAADGTIGRANAWVLSLRPVSATSPASSTAPASMPAEDGER